MKLSFVLLLLILCFSCQEKKGAYVCPPCDLPCDTFRFQNAGICPHCNMTLLKESDLIDESSLVLNEVQLTTGSSVFLIEGGKGNEEKSIKVYYYQSENFNHQSKVLIVIPGAGRNGDSYRDAWIAAADKYNVLILSPMYEEAQYPFEAYHLGGLLKTSNLVTSVEFEEHSNIARLKEDDLNFEVNKNKEEWLFNDFDRIFDLVITSLGTQQSTYDIFGHSAGGQILHRLVLFHEDSKAHKIIAANSGFYTLPDFETTFPFGIKDFANAPASLSHSFAKQLILLVGELDNETETGGTLLRSKTVDQQGLHRLERGKYFFEFAQNKAKALNTAFNWTIEVVPDVGHNHQMMGNAAAEILYE